MTILFSPPAGMTYAALTDTDTRDHAQEPFAALVKALDMVTPDTWDGRAVEALVCWDAPSPSVYRSVNGARKVLVAFEPFVVQPMNWQTALHDLFDAVVTWHDGYQFSRRYHKLHFPLPKTFPKLARKQPFQRRKLLTTINSNKRSPNPGERYSMRVKAIDFFQKHAPDEFTYYGMGWPEMPCYGGTPKHKADVLPRYRFALVIENQSEPGWITEKLYDVIRSGVVPIYYGAPNVTDTLDPQAFIDLRRYQGYGALLDDLRAMDVKTWDCYREAGAAVDLTRHYPDQFIQTIQKALQP